MPPTCSRCSRVNPADAQYCYFDGSVLDGHRASGPLNMGSQPFPTELRFPSGRACRNFDQLALACQQEGLAALEMLQQGDLANFLSGMGRPDLARVARDAAKAPNRARGLDLFLGALPSRVLQPGKLYVEPSEVNLGELKLGKDRQLSIRLVNHGMRLLYGSIVGKECVWLSLSEAPGTNQKLIQFVNELVLPLHVHGKYLAASSKPLEGRLVIETNGGDVTVVIRATVPVKPFPHGVLAGAVNPRQIAEKAKTSPRDASPLFESGAVARWYRDNGWNYPVQGAFSTGLGAIQQYFEAHGLARAPKVEISADRVILAGEVGELIEQQIEVRTQDKTYVYALATADQPWLKVECPPPKGRFAEVRIMVPSVPDQPGQTLSGRITVTANGNQRFDVPVMLTVSGWRTSGAVTPAAYTGEAIPHAIPISSEPFAPVGKTIPAASAVSSANVGVRADGETPTALKVGDADGNRPKRLRHLFPAGLLLLILGAMFVRDVFVAPRSGSLSKDDDVALLDSEPRLVLHVHDKPDVPDRQGRVVFNHPTMRFGLESHDPQDRLFTKRLMFDEQGRSNNTCIRVDGADYLFGEPPGRWREFKVRLGKDKKGREIDGFRSTWQIDEVPIQITQIVEIVPGQTSRLLDTCLVRYILENQDGRTHRVGLRFMLDTFIGANDGVPFTLPGSRELSDTSYEFASAAEVPDFIQALEREDLAHPGTVANLQLRLGGRIEAPERVTLGAWPNLDLLKREDFSKKFRGLINQHMTLWDVPVLSMKSIRTVDPRASADSCVVMYWTERDMRPKAGREVGFAYGLGSVATSAGGKLALTIGGSLVRGGEFTVTAYVTDPTRDQRLTLHLPDGMQIKDGNAERSVPPVAANAARSISTVTWKVTAAKAGAQSIRVVSNTGGEQSQRVVIRQRSIFD